jgi:hypothetical protein
MATSTGKGTAKKPAVHAQNNTPRTPPATMKIRRIEQADAAVASAEASVAKQEHHVAETTGSKRRREEVNLKASEKALAEAVAARKDLD